MDKKVVKMKEVDKEVKNSSNIEEDLKQPTEEVNSIIAYGRDEKGLEIPVASIMGEGLKIHVDYSLVSNATQIKGIAEEFGRIIYDEIIAGLISSNKKDKE